MARQHCRNCGAQLDPKKELCAICGVPVLSDQPASRTRRYRPLRLLTHTILAVLLVVVSYLYYPDLVPYLRLMWPPWLAPLVGEAIERLKDNGDAISIIGTPVRHSRLVRGYLEYFSGDAGRAQFQIAVSGSKGSGVLSAKLGQVDGTWVFSELQLQTDGKGVIDLLESPNDPPRRKLVADKRIYLVPIAKPDEIVLEGLPEFYKEHFGLEVIVSSPVVLEDSVWDRTRDQLIAEQLVDFMRMKLPHLARDEKAVLIAVTGEDMYFRERNWGFTYTYWDGDRGGAVSTARFAVSEEEKPDARVNARVRKMISRVIGMLALRLPRSEDPTSVLAKELYGSFSADLMSDNLDGLGAKAVIDGFKAAHWLPSISPRLKAETTKFDEKTVDGRYPCLVIQQLQRTRAGAAPSSASVTKCLPQSLLDGDVNELEIDFRTGKAVLKETDLYVSAKPPISATRCYQTWDDHSRAFGYNTSLAWDMFPTGRRNPYSEVGLNVCGSQFAFDRISEGQSYMNALFEHRRTATPFLRARFGWAGDGWNLDLADGTHMFFPESYNGKRAVDGAVVKFVSPNGEPIAIGRNKSRTLHSLSSVDGHFIRFDYDSRERVVKAYDDRGRTINYFYDIAGRLSEVKTAQSDRRYAYQGTYLISVYENQRRLFDLKYVRGRVGEVSLASGETFKMRYDYDTRDDSTVIRSSLVQPNGSVARFDFPPK